MKCLWTHNPFYLISVALVLHSVRLWHHDSIEAFNPWPLMSIIGGYLLLVAVTGFLLIKLGRVWDDARSIFLVILLLFVELSLIFDGILLRDVSNGTLLLVTGWSAAVVVSECLLLGLRMRLPWTYRGPYHLLLALMFLYPVFVMSGSGGSEAVVWRIFYFSPCVAVALLGLLPAVRRGRAELVQNGTPWNWPWYPWTLFGFLTVCLSLRAWALTLSFDPVTNQGLDDAMRMQGMFGSYFLIPVVLSLGVLLLEASLVERRQILNVLGLIAPAVCLVLAIPFEGGSLPYLEFRNQFADRFGSPFWLSLNFCWAFYTYALIRGVKESIAGVLGAALAIMVFGRIWPSPAYLLGFPAIPLLVSAAIAMIRGAIRNDSRIFLAGLLGVTLAARDMSPEFWSPLLREAIAWNLASTGILLTGLLFHDRAAKYWQRAGSMLLAVNCALAAIIPAIFELRLPNAAPLTYCVLATFLAVAYASVTRLRECRISAVVCLVISAARAMLEFAELLKKNFHWDGALYFVVGIGTFAVAVAISTLKSTSSPIASPTAEENGQTMM
ncbi:MAG: hypothetical protein JWM11_2372 [Planctomycetaceae bacterium]|nr:hypothetical protein [Planctomycetaceae bacterium]